MAVSSLRRGSIRRPELAHAAKTRFGSSASRVARFCGAIDTTRGRHCGCRREPAGLRRISNPDALTPDALTHWWLCHGHRQEPAGASMEQHARLRSTRKRWRQLVKFYLVSFEQDRKNTRAATLHNRQAIACHNKLPSRVRAHDVSIDGQRRPSKQSSHQRLFRRTNNPMPIAGPIRVAQTIPTNDFAAITHYPAVHFRRRSPRPPVNPIALVPVILPEGPPQELLKRTVETAPPSQQKYSYTFI